MDTHYYFLGMRKCVKRLESSSTSLPIEPRHEISNAARLGFHQVMTHYVGLRPIPLEMKTTCFVDRPLVKGSAKLSFDLM